MLLDFTAHSTSTESNLFEKTTGRCNVIKLWSLYQNNHNFDINCVHNFHFNFFTISETRRPKDKKGDREILYLPVNPASIAAGITGFPCSTGSLLS